MRQKHPDDRYSRPVSTRFPPGLLENAEALANKQDRTLSNLIIIAVRQYLEREGKRK